MRRLHIACIAAVVFSLALAFAGPANAYPWPDYGASAGNEFDFNIAFASSTFTLTWAGPEKMIGFVAYVDAPTGVTLPGTGAHAIHGYTAALPTGWGENGGWEAKNDAANGIDSAFGWTGSGASDLQNSGVVCQINGLTALSGFSPGAWNAKYVAHVYNPGTGLTYWARPGGTPPSVPEPGTLALLALGLTGAFGVIRRKGQR